MNTENPTTNEAAIYENRAHPVTSDGKREVHECFQYDCCNETLVFAMRDNGHEFSIGLSTILECLAIAEHEGHVPKLPFDWWTMV